MRFHELAKEMRAAMAGYAPDNMDVYRRDLDRLPEAMRDIAAALRSLHVGAADLPVHQAIRDALGAIVMAQSTAASVADDVVPAYLRLHEKELARYSDPRPGEQKWNV